MNQEMKQMRIEMLNMSKQLGSMQIDRIDRAVANIERVNESGSDVYKWLH